MYLARSQICLVKSLKGSWPFWLHHKIDAPPKKKRHCCKHDFVFATLIAKSGDVPHKNLAKFGYYKLKMKNKIKFGKHPSIIFLLTYLNYVYINLAIFSSILSPSIENLKKRRILALFTFQCTILTTYICVRKNLSFYFSLYFDGSPPTGYPYGVMWWGGDPPVFVRSHVPMKRFFDEMDQENSKKQEGKNGRNEKKRFLKFFFGNIPGGSPYSCVPHWLGMPSCYRLRATLPQENPLVWDPPPPTT